MKNFCIYALVANTGSFYFCYATFWAILPRLTTCKNLYSIQILHIRKMGLCSNIQPLFQHNKVISKGRKLSCIASRICNLNMNMRWGNSMNGLFNGRLWCKTRMERIVPLPKESRYFIHRKLHHYVEICSHYLMGWQWLLNPPLSPDRQPEEWGNNYF